MFKLVHYEARMVGKWAVGIILECFLVTHCFTMFVHFKNWLPDFIDRQPTKGGRSNTRCGKADGRMAQYDEDNSLSYDVNWP